TNGELAGALLPVAADGLVRREGAAGNGGSREKIVDATAIAQTAAVALAAVVASDPRLSVNVLSVTLRTAPFSFSRAPPPPSPPSGPPSARLLVNWQLLMLAVEPTSLSRAPPRAM